MAASRARCRLRLSGEARRSKWGKRPSIGRWEVRVRAPSGAQTLDRKSEHGKSPFLMHAMASHVRELREV